MYQKSPEYLDYLIKNCGVKGFDDKKRSEQFARPDINIILTYTNMFGIQPSDKVLEVGSGIGRVLKELHDTYNIKPYGIDPFEDAVNAAKERVSNLCSAIKVSSAEKIAFNDDYFDKIICWGVFDLTDQTQALKEMSRCLKVGGRLLLTGKTNNYHYDDEEALLAEKASLQKGINNHYTDFDCLIKWAKNLGMSPIKTFYFNYRGDFMRNHFQETKPDHFYEYAIFFEKTNQGVEDHGEFPIVGHKSSLTLLKKAA